MILGIKSVRKLSWIDKFMEVNQVFAEFLSFIGLLLMIGGVIFGLFSMIRYFVKRDITNFPIILGGAIFIVGICMVFIAGILIENQDNNSIDVNSEENISTNTENEKQTQEPEQSEPNLDEFLLQVKSGNPITNYTDYIDNNNLEIERNYTIYGRIFDELIIDNKSIVVVYSDEEIIEVDTQNEFDNIVNTFISEIQNKLTTEINGSGDQGSDSIKLLEGFAVFDSKYSGNSNFAVELQDGQGNFIDLLVNEIGNYSGKSFVWIEEENDYYLNVKGNEGEWNIEITQFYPLDLQSLPGELVGTGDDVIFFEIDSGSYQISLGHEGEGNFAVLLDGTDLLVNEIGSYTGSQRYSFNDSSVYLFEVKAQGDWRIQVEK